MSAVTAPPDVTGRPPIRGAVLWSVLMATGRRVTTTLVTFVLAGLLGPGDFGTVALATIFVFLAQLLFQQGLAPALIRLPRLTERTADVVLRLAVVGSLVVAGLVVAAAPLAGRLFGDREVVDVLRALALLLPLQALFMVQEALRRRESDFRTLALRTNTSIMLGGLLGVVAAVLGAGVWALVLQQAVTTAVGVAALWTAPGAWRPNWRPRRWWRDDEVPELLHFSTRTSAASMAQFLQTQLDSLLAGLFFGVVAVGLYRLASRLVESVLDVGARSVQMTVLPDLARQTDMTALGLRLRSSQRTLCSLALPPLGLLAGASAPLVAVLGDEWRPAATPIALLALAAVGTTATSVVTPALQALGRAGLLLWLNTASVLLLLVTLCLAGSAAADLDVRGQVTALAAARAVVGALLLVLQLVVLARVGRLSLSALLTPALPGASAGLVGAAVGFGVAHLTAATSPPLCAALSVVLATAAALLVLLLTDPHLATTLVRRLPRRLNARHASRHTPQSDDGTVLR